jgi:hypothetical protein
MWKVPGVDCGSTFEETARRVIPVRVAEVYSHTPSLKNSRDGVGLHDLRISIKRLRYSLEFFAICFDPAEVEAVLTALSDMQELLGDIHDADVLIPELQLTLGEVVERHDAAARRGKTDLDRAAEEIGLLGLLHRMRKQRASACRRASALWKRLEAQGFRERLDRLGAQAPAAAGGR